MDPENNRELAAIIAVTSQEYFSNSSEMKTERLASLGQLYPFHTRNRPAIHTDEMGMSSCALDLNPESTRISTHDHRVRNAAGYLQKPDR